MDKQTEYVEKLSAEMVEWDAQIDRLKYKEDSTMSAAKSDYSGAIEALQHKRDEAALKLQGVSVASNHEWEEMKSGTELVWGEVRSMLHNTITKIK
jgi:hypothetical protein